MRLEHCGVMQRVHSTGNKPVTTAHIENLTKQTNKKTIEYVESVKQILPKCRQTNAPLLFVELCHFRRFHSQSQVEMVIDTDFFVFVSSMWILHTKKLSHRRLRNVIWGSLVFCVINKIYQP